MSSMPSLRGGFAPRRGQGGWKKPFFKSKREHVKPDTSKNPLGQLLKTLSSSDLRVESTESFIDTPISDVQYVASYNWRGGGSNTILVPGKPPRWTPLKDAPHLNEDSGQYYRDPNAARYPEYPIAPVVQSVLDMHPSFPTADIDIVACGSTLGNLLRFVRGQDKSFRFAVEIIGNTVFFIRKENDPREIIPDVRGYGHSFPERNTTWENDVKGSETHQRILRYKLGSLNCMVRFECDGYIKDDTIQGNEIDKPSASASDTDLLSAFGKAAITQPLSTQFLHAGGVEVEHGGAEIPQHSIFDLKTRSGRYKSDIDMSDIHPQLWIKQIPNFIVAYHDGAGLFRDVRVQDVRNDVKGWEKQNIDAIQRLTVLLKVIVEFARDDGGLLEIYSPTKDCLELRKQFGEGTHVLPSMLRDRWVEQGGADIFLSDSDDEGNLSSSEGTGSGDAWEADSDDDEPDYTACSAEDCGYCGKCTY